MRLAYLVCCVCAGILHVNAYLDTVIPEHLKVFNQSTNPVDVQLRLLTVMNLMQQVCSRIPIYFNLFKQWNLYSGHWYKLFEIELMWVPAENFCRELGGHLVSIKDAAENDFIHRIRKSKLCDQRSFSHK